jgi:hypothetical protein
MRERLQHLHTLLKVAFGPFASTMSRCRRRGIRAGLTSIGPESQP